MVSQIQPNTKMPRKKTTTPPVPPTTPPAIPLRDLYAAAALTGLLSNPLITRQIDRLDVLDPDYPGFFQTLLVRTALNYGDMAVILRQKSE